MLEKVEVWSVDRWGFECPECGDWNEFDEDPSYQDEVYCEGCGKSFEPDVKQ